MIFWDCILFNILFNSVLSFLGGLLIASLGVQIFRIKSPELKLYLLSLPFIKVIVDIVRGIPPESYVWTNLNFYSLPENLGRRLSATVFFSEFGPRFALKLGIENKLNTNYSESLLYSISLPDAAYSWIKGNCGNLFIPLGLTVALSISLVLVIRRILAWIRFERGRVKDRKNNGLQLSLQKHRFRVVDIYLSPTYRGTPFTGGILKPYICFPNEAYNTLNEDERSDVIGHELAHMSHFDIVQTIIIRIIGDVFWFIPCYRMLARRVDQLREIVADKFSSKLGVDRAFLAKALIKLKSVEHRQPETATYSTLFEHKKSIVERVEYLVQPSTKTHSNFLKTFISGVGILLVTGAVLSSTFVGNYQIDHPSKISQYFERLMASFFSTM